MQQGRVRALVAAFLLGGCVAEPDFAGPMPVRNQHPAQLTVLHLPTTGARSLPTGRVAVRGDAAYSNLFLLGSGPNSARWKMDGEYLRAAASVRAGLGSGLELGLEAPFAHTSGGFLDSFVIDYHDTFGLPDQNRQNNPRDAFEIAARRGGSDVWTVSEESATLLDVPLWLAWQITDPADGLGLAVRGGVELPTGNDRRGYGNGEIDTSVGVVLERHAFGCGVYGHAQHTFAGTPDQSRDQGLRFRDVTSAGLAVEAPLDTGLAALLQVEWETSTLRAVDTPTLQREQLLLWVGFRLGLDRDTNVEVGFGEDLIGLASPDFTAWLAFTWTPGLAGR